jgi:hypothetical protein
MTLPSHPDLIRLIAACCREPEDGEEVVRLLPRTTSRAPRLTQVPVTPDATSQRERRQGQGATTVNQEGGMDHGEDRPEDESAEDCP